MARNACIAPSSKLTLDGLATWCRLDNDDKHWGKQHAGQQTSAIVTLAALAIVIVTKVATVAAAAIYNK